ncbi:S26 family signal peptidase [Caldiplasma sukawensis]
MVTNTSQFQYPSLIIIHNSVFLAEILIGSFFLLLPTLGAILSDSLITTPILLYLITTGHYNSILPQLLLELIGTSLATGSAFLIFYTFFTSMITRNRTYDFIRTMLYSKKVILFGIILSIYAFIVAWPIESELVLLPNINSQNWFHAIYLFDVIVIIIYTAFLYDILVRKVFPLQKLILPSFWAGIFLFIVLAGGGKYEQTLTFELLLLAFFSLLYPTFELAKSIAIHKNSKRFDNLQIGTSFAIHKIIGKSMFPTLYSGDYLITYLTDDKFLFKVGDIITYEPLLAYSPISDSRYVSHRIIELRKDNIVTKGDNLKKADPPIKPFRIIGVAVASLDTKTFVFSSLTEREELLEIVKEAERTVVQGKANLNNIEGNIKKSYFYMILFSILISLVLPILFLFA